MTIQPLKFPAGIYKDFTDYTSALRWVDADKVRFRQGLPERIGGWEKYITDTLDAPIRDIYPWSQLDGTRNLGIGSRCYLYVEQGGQAYDITPYRITGDALGTDPFTTTDTSTTVQVAHTGHGAVDGDRVTYSGASDFNGVTLSGEFVITVVDVDNYTIESTTVATASGTGGGASVTASYTINCGEADATFSYGWGTGTFGTGTFGTARTTSNVTLSPRTWSLDNWGEDLIAVPMNGTAYLWDASAGINSRATEITQAPDEIGIFRVSSPDRHAIAFGSHDGSAYDPMRVAWSDQEDYTDWTPSATNTAGSQRLAEGSFIQAAEKARSQILIWTDSALYSMQFIGPPFTFGFQQLGSNCGTISTNGAITYENAAFWFGDNNFYMYDGAVKVIDCPVLDYVFDDFNYQQREKIITGLNKQYHEVWWHYPSSSSNENDRYVAYNYKEKHWTIGTMGRTAWYDQGVLQYPVAVDSSGQLYNHEIGITGDGSAIDFHIESGDFEIPLAPNEPPGERMFFMNRVIPDNVLTGTSSVDFTIKTRKYPNAEEISKGPYTVTASTEKTNLRARGRQMSLRIEGSDLDNLWKMGVWRVDVKPSGRR